MCHGEEEEEEEEEEQEEEKSRMKGAIETGKEMEVLMTGHKQTR